MDHMKKLMDIIVFLIAKLTRFSIMESVNVHLVLLKLLVNASGHVVLMKFGKEINVVVILDMLSSVEFAENVQHTQNL